MKKTFFFLLITISIIGCISPLQISESEYQIFKLTNEKAQSPEGDYFTFIPQGWFSTKDNTFGGNEIWLVKENYTGIIQLRKIHIPSKIQSNNDLENLLEIAKVNLILHQRKNKSTFKLISPPRLYQNGNIIYASFEYKFGESQIARIVIIRKNNFYFECNAYNSPSKYGKISQLELFSVQESVISSLNPD